MIPSGKNIATKIMNAAEKMGWSSGVKRLVTSKAASRTKAPRIGPKKVPAPPKRAMRMGKRTQLRLKAPPVWM